MEPKRQIQRAHNCDNRPYCRYNSVANDIRKVDMEPEGIVSNGVIIPDDATLFPEGTRVRIARVSSEKVAAFGERYARFKGAVPGLPKDLAEQHDHYRLGIAKR